MKRKYFLISIGLATATASQPACAGPPYITDDPEPTELHKWEIYNFVGGTREDGFTSANMGIDINYGPVRDVQITAVLPLHAETGAPLETGDVELAAKFKFLHQRANSFSADVTFFPRVFLPTGRGSSHTQLLLPIWAQRDFGKWSLFGGGGYTINPGPGNRNFWVEGAALNRQVRPALQLGIEEYYQGPDTDDAEPLLGVNLGATVHIKGPLSLLGAFGQGINRKQTSFYSALKLDF